MSDEISASTNLHDISLNFCANCLKKFCSKVEQINFDKVRFFVPTLDVLFRNHFAYIEVSKEIVDIIYRIEDHVTVDLSEIAEVLHIEMGDLPSYERKEEIKSFY
ncbi:hypothetical protein [Legionella cincinnatiensis]|uniref:Uncharacterized protein n=1 Tax=Legionella cincinnatiensis TaxID=28085 RepID=A0A378IG11_9GAMM|nr:hypothetical protein [Legionella cincinnatiensis]KTC82718.1 hypothetical protein Lcin_2747 [Legionella cincinnatiensis]STX34149.1 Uncharacterised protein [Legionella cincinnatiensis]